MDVITRCRVQLKLPPTTTDQEVLEAVREQVRKLHRPAPWWQQTRIVGFADDLEQIRSMHVVKYHKSEGVLHILIDTYSEVQYSPPEQNKTKPIVIHDRRHVSELTLC